MLDHIKMVTDNQEIIRKLLAHPDFENKYYEGRTSKYEFLKIHKEYKGKIKMVFYASFEKGVIVGYHNVKISIFPHFHYNNYLHNGNDLNKTNCIDALYEILDYLRLEEKEYQDFKIINLEVGINLYLETDAREFIDSIKLYKTHSFVGKSEYEYYKISDTTNYKNIKVYAKGLQHQKNLQYGIPINTVRYELRSNQSKYIKKYLGVYSLKDLLNGERYIGFSEVLLNEWDNILKQSRNKKLKDLALTTKQREFINNAQKERYWEKLIDSNKNAVKKKREQYNNYTSSAINSHQRIKESIEGKLQYLLL